MKAQIIGIIVLVAVLVLAVACGDGEVRPLPTSLGGFTVGETFEPDGPEWRSTDFGDMVQWEKQQGKDGMTIATDKDGKIQIITLNLFLYSQTPEEGDKSLIQKYQDEIWEYKQAYKSIAAGKDKAGNEVFVDANIAMTVNLYMESAQGPTRYVKTIKTRATYDEYTNRP
ncbi:MAG TPA: hypothetical protein VMX35_13040 [Acidobacteriota bacterium]|nr:hypothetical protein [Acidobacteriota bacterium]